MPVGSLPPPRDPSPDGILEWFRRKPIDEDWSFAECKPSDTGKWTHGYHRYPAKFIPQLVEKLCDEYLPDRRCGGDPIHLSDPFFGCGTTIVTGISRGYRASGTDINGIAYLMTRAKATPIEPEHLHAKVLHFLDRIEWIGSGTSSERRIEPLMPERHQDRIDHWFPQAQSVALGRILRLIRHEEDQAIRDFLLVGFSHVLKTCSIWLQSSTKPTRDRTKTPAEPSAALKRHLRRMERGNLAFFHVTPPHVRERLTEYLRIHHGDARHQPLLDDSVDLIVSSSPYVTSYEYADLHQLSTLWLDLAEDLTEYRKTFIGTSAKGYEGRSLQSRIADRIVDEMLPRSPKTAREIEAFFLDMEQVFDESFRILKPGGRCCYVIGNTRLKQVSIRNAEVFAETIQHSGFRLDRVVKREIPSKILPQKRDEKTGRFASTDKADTQAYPVEYIVIGVKEKTSSTSRS